MTHLFRCIYPIKAADSLITLGNESLAGFLLGQETDDSGRHRFDIFGLNKQGDVARNFRDGGTVRSDHRDSLRHRFNDGKAEAFNERRQDKDTGWII